MVSTLAMARPKKRLFLGLMLTSEFVVAVLLYVIWKIAYPGLSDIYVHLPFLLSAFLIVVSTFSVGAVCNMVLAMRGFPYLPMFRKYTYDLIRFLFPVSVRIGKLFGISRRQLEGSFIAVSNLLFIKCGIKVKADRLLMIVPHCLQLAACPHKITRDPNNCKRCGGCNIGDLMKLSEEYGFYFLVATGGTLARQFVKDVRPKAVIAIACERDLMSGIQDVYPLPAVGVLNIRPNGPCYNTRVNIDDVKKMLDKIII